MTIRIPTEDGEVNLASVSMGDGEALRYTVDRDNLDYIKVSTLNGMVQMAGKFLEDGSFVQAMVTDVPWVGLIGGEGPPPEGLDRPVGTLYLDISTNQYYRFEE